VTFSYCAASSRPSVFYNLTFAVVPLPSISPSTARPHPISHFPFGHPLGSFVRRVLVLLRLPLCCLSAQLKIKTFLSTQKGATPAR